MQRKFIVQKKYEGKRLDLFLTFMNNDLTRSFIKKLITNNQVKVNGQIEYRTNYRVNRGDVILFEFENTNTIHIAPEKIDIDIVYEDENLLIVNKESGMVVHPATGHISGTLMNAITYKYKNLIDIGDKIRSTLINRIDKDTSGIVFVGKTNRGVWYYSKLFAEREIDKNYLVIVHGNFSNKVKDEKGELTLTTYIGRNPKNRKKYVIADKTYHNAKLAITKFSLIAVSRDGKYSLILAKPVTGRTHQIRVHLKSISYPVVGDTIYGKNDYQRLLLHSYKVRFPKLDSTKIIEVKAPFGQDFRKFLNENFNYAEIKHKI